MLATIIILSAALNFGTVHCQNNFFPPGPRQVDFGGGSGGRPGPLRGQGNGPARRPPPGSQSLGFGRPGPVAFNGQSGAGEQSSGGGGCSEGTCKYYTECALFLPEVFSGTRREFSRCVLPEGTEGVCCGNVDGNVANAAPLANRLGGNRSPPPGVDTNTIQNSVGNSQIYFNELDNTEQRLLERDLSVKRGTSAFGHLLFFQTSPRAIELSRLGLQLVQSSRELVNSGRVQDRFTGNKNELGDGLTGISAKSTSLTQQCPTPIQCDSRFSNNYRTADGTCNNLNNPRHGSSFTPLIRLVRPEYADGIWTPRKGKDGRDLASARAVSAALSPDVDAPNPYYTLWVMQFGQFIDHDLSHVPVNRFRNGSGIQCCTEEGDFLPNTLSHRTCLPIEIPSNDAFYRPFRQRCMNFVRSMVGVREDCSFGYADQLNQITSYLDASNIYGSTSQDQRQLRSFQGGQLKTERFSASNELPKGMLPLQTNAGDECTEPDKGTFCFRAGDRRVNEMVGLTVTHLVWLREHNRVASILAQFNPQWDDEVLFQETRKIVTAEYQHIIYNEWLPIVVGRKFMEVYGILPQSRGYYRGYDPRIDPGVSNAFSAAAFRMGHTLIQGLFPLLNEVGQTEDALVIHEHFNRPFKIQERRMVDKLLRGLSAAKIQGFDGFVTSEVTNRLFQPDNKPFGMDLISLNIQRAREHGIPGYNAYRELCQLRKARQFEDFSDWIDPAIISKLRQYYGHVDDVDLFVAGTLERPLPGALMGPTFTCIIGDQFARARKGDRFTYDQGPSPHSFSEPQLKQIRKASFARILCDNGDDLRSIQPFVLLTADREPFAKLQWKCNPTSGAIKMAGRLKVVPVPAITTPIHRFQSNEINP